MNDIDKLMTCNICILAPAMRVCNVCEFDNPWRLLVIETPEPEYADVVAMAYMEFPDPDISRNTWENPYQDEFTNERREKWQAFLSRMNAPEMVERRGTKLTPYGWRKP